MKSASAFLALVLASPALAQSDIPDAHKFSWQENVGWMNWRDANATAQGVDIKGRFLAGYIWGENVGWIHVGDGSPTSGIRYANVDNTDYGVNIEQDGSLSGYAWGENVGWINFNTKPTLQAFNQHARVDDAALRFRGYAWGENIGWVNMDDAAHYVGMPCRADFAAPFGSLNVFDFLGFQTAFGNNAPEADMDRNGVLNVFDFLGYQTAFGLGC